MFEFQLDPTRNFPLECFIQGNTSTVREQNNTVMECEKNSKTTYVCWNIFCSNKRKHFKPAFSENPVQKDDFLSINNTFQNRRKNTINKANARETERAVAM